jgi:hypothetical protein
MPWVRWCGRRGLANAPEGALEGVEPGSTGDLSTTEPCRWGFVLRGRQKPRFAADDGDVSKVPVETFTVPKVPFRTRGRQPTPQVHAMKVPFETPNDPKGTFETSSRPRINQQHR